MSIRTRVACIAVRDGKVVLMEKLVPSYFTYNQLTPPGGGVEVHETLEQACIREMEEETGLSVANPTLKGVVSYINHASKDSHSVTFFFVSHHVEGELTIKEPEKHNPHWVELERLQQHEKVPEYYKAFIQVVLQGRQMLNARVEWNKSGSNEPLQWSMAELRKGEQ